MVLEFTEQQVVYLLQTLSQRPIAEAMETFNSIQRQATQQQQAMQGQQRLQAVNGEAGRPLPQ